MIIQSTTRANKIIVPGYTVRKYRGFYECRLSSPRLLISVFFSFHTTWNPYREKGCAFVLESNCFDLNLKVQDRTTYDCTFIFTEEELAGEAHRPKDHTTQYRLMETNPYRTTIIRFAEAVQNGNVQDKENKRSLRKSLLQLNKHPNTSRYETA